jgi:hypothetical protein
MTSSTYSGETKKMQTFKEFYAAIVENVRAEIDDLPHGSMVTWFPDPNGRPTVFRQSKPCPLDPESIIFAIFQGPTDARVYTLGAPPPDPKPTGWTGRAPTRYTLTKTAPTFVAETMTLEAMANEMAEEWNQIADGVNAADIELESVIEYIEGLAVGSGFVAKADLIEGLRNEDHRDLPDDEPETEPDASAAPSAPADAPAQEAPPS